MRARWTVSRPHVAPDRSSVGGIGQSKGDLMDPLYKNLKGRFKEAAGALTGNDKLRDEGVA